MVRRVWTSMSRFWETDESFSVLLVLLIAFELILPPLLADRGQAGPGPVADALFTLLLLAGMAAVWREERWAFLVVAVFSLVALPIRWIARLDPDAGFAVWSVGSTVAALTLLTFVVLAKVLRPGMITSYRIQGAVAAYLLVGLAWAAAYEWVALRNPSAFSGVGASSFEGTQWIYYSLVTLTTTGFGDITPVAPVARSLSVAEALAGQLYLAILISRLVALELHSRRVA
jgi:hypothetical protein